MSSYRNTVLIFNPRAGKLGKNYRAQIEQVAAILEREGCKLTLAPTTGPQTAAAIVREQVKRGADRVVAAGGDGTINEVAEGLVHTPVPLGIVPAGTANVLANELKLGCDIERAARRLSACRPYRVSVGHLTCEGGAISRHFLLMAGAGLDAHIVYRVSAPIKERTGKLAYWLAGCTLLGRPLPEFRVRTAGQERKCSFALVSRVRNYGGNFRIAPTISLLDNCFEIVLFEGRSSLRYLKYLAGVAVSRVAGMSGVTVLREQCLKIYAPEDRRIYIQIDGEFAGHLPAEIRIVPDALTVLLPDEYSSRKPR